MNFLGNVHLAYLQFCLGKQLMQQHLTLLKTN